MTPLPKEIADVVADDYDDSDQPGCWNCDEGFVTGCSWDWQCDTYDEGEGTCLCIRRCPNCNAPPRDPALDAVLAAALKEQIT